VFCSHCLNVYKNLYLWSTNKTVVATVMEIDALIQPKVNVKVPAIMQANILHNSDGYVRDARQNS
jgi:hypothetical protein